MNLCKNVKVTEEKLALNNSKNLELTSKLEEISEKVRKPYSTQYLFTEAGARVDRLKEVR